MIFQNRIFFIFRLYNRSFVITSMGKEECLCFLNIVCVCWGGAKTTGLRFEQRNWWWIILPSTIPTCWHQQVGLVNIDNLNRADLSCGSIKIVTQVVLVPGEDDRFGADFIKINEWEKVRLALNCLQMWRRLRTVQWLDS